MPALPSSYVPEILIEYADENWITRLRIEAEAARAAFNRRPTDIRRERFERALRDYQLASGIVPLPKPTHQTHERYC